MQQREGQTALASSAACAEAQHCWHGRERLLQLAFLLGTFSWWRSWCSRCSCTATGVAATAISALQQTEQQLTTYVCCAELSGMGCLPLVAGSFWHCQCGDS
jgi:hypothetical protein